MSTTGRISIVDVAKKYNLGFEYADNVINRLETIGYIKKKGKQGYEIIQTQQEIDHYIKSHLAELRPAQYDELGIKDNGERTLKSIIEFKAEYYKATLPLWIVLIKRTLFSIPQLILLVLTAWLLFPKDLLKPISVFSIFFYFLKLYIFFGIPVNILIRLCQSKLYKMSLKEVMVLPRNWFFNRLKDTVELQKLLIDNNIKFRPGTYGNVSTQIQPILQEKKSLVEYNRKIADSTKDENEFYQSINNCIDTLEWLTQFESFDFFPDNEKPSHQIKTIKDGMSLSIQKFYKRTENPQSVERSEKPMKDTNNPVLYCQKQLEKIKELEIIVNTTTNEKEFALSLNEITRILYDLTSYEDKVMFSILPSDQLKRIQKNRSKTFDLFYQRVEKSNSLNKVDKMNGHEFEYFCADVVKKNDFINVEVTQGSGDHGIDILAEKDGITYAIQCKCYSSNIGNAAVQQAHTGKSLYHRDIAVVLTNRYFTAQAKEEAQALGVKLWDRDKLNSLIESMEENPVNHEERNPEIDIKRNQERRHIMAINKNLSSEPRERNVIYHYQDNGSSYQTKSDRNSAKKRRNIADNYS